MIRARWILAVTLLTVGASAACESSTGPDADADFRGILAWDDPPAFAQAQAAQTGGDEPQAIHPPALEAPDTVDVSEPFSVSVTTVLPNGCWQRGDAASTVEGSVATIDVFDRGPRDDNALCTLIFSWASRDIDLVFDEEGEAVIRVVGRRIQGDGYSEETEHTVEQVVIVR